MASHVPEEDRKRWSYEAVNKYGKDILTPHDPSTAERNYAQLSDKLTRTMKNIARPSYGDRGLMGVNGRALQPIGFKGSNKIIAIIENFPSKEIGERDKLYVRYGTVPQDAINQWEQRVGKWNPS